MLDRMEEKGLIRRKDNSEDKRSIKIMLTDKAKELEKDYNDISILNYMLLTHLIQLKE